MSKISKIANSGVQYDLGGSGDDNIKLVNFTTGFLLLKKVTPDIVLALLNLHVNSNNNTNRVSATGDFAGFEGYALIMLPEDNGRELTNTELTVSSKEVSIFCGYSVFTKPQTSGVGIYRVGSVKKD